MLQQEQEGEGKTFHLFIRLLERVERGSRISRMISEGENIHRNGGNFKSHFTVFITNP
jgi:hypothetical protein